MTTFKKMLERIWFDEYFRIFCILIPSYFIFLIPLLAYFNVLSRDILSIFYVGMLIIATIFNTPSNKSEKV